jgi:hypothetical protein
MVIGKALQVEKGSLGSKRRAEVVFLQLALLLLHVKSRGTRDGCSVDLDLALVVLTLGITSMAGSRTRPTGFVGGQSSAFGEGF